MSDKVFIDSNLLIYSVSTEMSKRAAVESLFQKNYDFVISIQVVNEFSNVCFKKNLLSATDLEKLVNGFFAFFKVSPIEASTISLAYSIKSRYGFSYYDALIVATALENDCTVLFSEDLQHNQLIENTLQVKKPVSSLTIPANRKVGVTLKNIPPAAPAPAPGNRTKR